MTADKPMSIDEVVDRMAIQDVLARYVHAIDQRDWDDLDNVFLPGTRFDLTTAGSIAAPWSEVKPHLKTNLARFVRDFHHFSSIKIDFGPDGNTASTKSKVINPRGLQRAGGDGSGTDGSGGAGGGEELRYEMAFGVYYDQWRRTGDGWRITERVWKRAFLWDD